MKSLEIISATKDSRRQVGTGGSFDIPTPTATPGSTPVATPIQTPIPTPIQTPIVTPTPNFSQPTQSSTPFPEWQVNSTSTYPYSGFVVTSPPPIFQSNQSYISGNVSGANSEYEESSAPFDIKTPRPDLTKDPILTTPFPSLSGNFSLPLPTPSEQSGNGQNTNIGAIAGGVVGGVSFVVLIAAISYYAHKKWHNSSNQNYKIINIVPSSAPSSPTKNSFSMRPGNDESIGNQGRDI